MRKRQRVIQVGNRVLLPHAKVLLKQLSRPMHDDEIEKSLLPLSAFQAALTQGSATYHQYHHMIDSVYHFLALLEILTNLPRLSSDQDYNEKCKIELTQVALETTERAAQLIDSIGKRFNKTGKFGATAEELNTLEWVKTNFNNVLEFVDFKHYFQALDISQQRLVDIRAGRGVQSEWKKKNFLTK